MTELRSTILSLSALSFAYREKCDVLRDINLQIAPQERIGLVGPNGAGKTTLFLLICGILPPRQGRITLRGIPIMPGSFHPEIGMVFQNPDDQLFCPSVRDDVAFGPQNLGLARVEVETRVLEALNIAGVSTLADRPPHHLSGGEKRMVAIAGILAMRPQVIIYDEPSSNLDIRSRRRLIRFLQTTPETLLIASHDLEFILEVCTRVIVLDAGRIVADGLPQEVLGDVALMEAHGLERPHSLIPHAVLHHSAKYSNSGCG